MLVTPKNNEELIELMSYLSILHLGPQLHYCQDLMRHPQTVTEPEHPPLCSHLYLQTLQRVSLLSSPVKECNILHGSEQYLYISKHPTCKCLCID